MLLVHLRDRFRTASHTALATPGLMNPGISNVTVRRRLHSAGLAAIARRPYRGPVLVNTCPPPQQMEVVPEASEMESTAMERNFAVSDESRFCVYCPDGREGVWRRRTL